MDFTSGKSLEDYRGNAILRSAVERQFEIVGEALSQLATLDEKIVSRISRATVLLDGTSRREHPYIPSSSPRKGSLHD